MSDPFDEADIRRSPDGSYTVTFGGSLHPEATGHGAKYHANADDALAYYARIIRRVGAIEQAARGAGR